MKIVRAARGTEVRPHIESDLAILSDGHNRLKSAEPATYLTFKSHSLLHLTNFRRLITKQGVIFEILYF